MSGKDAGTQGSYASPPCLAAEIAPDYFDPLGCDPQQASDVARWRKACRAALLADRTVPAAAARQVVADAIAGHLDRLLAARFPDLSGRVISAYWPIKSEPDLRPWMARWHAAGAIMALPVVDQPRQPLIFRRWTPDTVMQRGHWNILVPAAGPALLPDITLAPLVGWDPGFYRLGYGGGYFDRTLAALHPRPFVIGTGLQSARLATIYPQPHDIALDAIVTEAGIIPRN